MQPPRCASSRADTSEGPFERETWRYEKSLTRFTSVSSQAHPDAACPRLYRPRRLCWTRSRTTGVAQRTIGEDSARDAALGDGSAPRATAASDVPTPRKSSSMSRLGPLNGTAVSAGSTSKGRPSCGVRIISNRSPDGTA